MYYGRFRTGKRKAVAALGAVIAIGLSLFGFTASPASAASPETAGHAFVHCPWGYVCVYPEEEDPFINADVYPESSGKYYTYGYHKLHNQYGMHYIVDNQSIGQYLGDHGDVETTNCNGVGLNKGDNLSGGFSYVNLTPVNCIILY